MENICEKEYASFLEEVLQHLVHMPVSGICVLIKLEDGSVAIHDTVHEMARDEARHGKAFEGLLARYFG